MSMVGIIGLLLAIAILIFGAYKGLGALPLTMIAALVAIVFNGIPLWEGFATHYMAGYTSAYMSYFLMFACSALYAKLMDESGCATAIGYKFIDWFGRKNIMLVTILIVSVLTYGGVSLFVVVYAVAPIMFLLFKEANLPRHLTMACLIVGSATYTMTTLPGTPQLTNVVPTEYLGTTMTAAPVLSIICTVAIFALCLLYCTWAKNRAVARGEVWSYPDNVDPALFEIKDRSLLPPAWKAFLPIVVLLLVIIVGGRFVSNSTMLATCAMLLGAVLTYVLNFPKFKGKDWKALLGDGLGGGISGIGGLRHRGAELRCLPGYRGLGAQPGHEPLCPGRVRHQRVLRHHRLLLRRPAADVPVPGGHLYQLRLQSGNPPPADLHRRRRPGHPAPLPRPVPDVQRPGAQPQERIPPRVCVQRGDSRYRGGGGHRHLRVCRHLISGRHSNRPILTEGSRHGKSENGRENVLVDTGMRVEYFTQMAIGDVKPKGSTEILLASLAEEGLKPEDIDTVIYTHLHNDHAGNADLFPDAVTYVQKAEYDNMLSPYPFQKARMDYFPDTPERLSKVKRLLLVDGDLKLANGLELYLTPGHSRGGQTIVVPTEKGRYVITGDNSATKYCLFADMDKMTLMDGTVINITPDHTIPHLTGRFTTDRFAFYDSARKQLALAEKPEPEYFLLSHDTETAYRRHFG